MSSATEGWLYYTTYCVNVLLSHGGDMTLFPIPLCNAYLLVQIYELCAR